MESQKLIFFVLGCRVSRLLTFQAYTSIMAPTFPRFWKYMTPAVLSLAIGMQAPLWYAARAAGMAIIIAVGFLIYSVVALSVDVQENAGKEQENVSAEERARMKSAILRKLRLSGALFVCALCIVGPTAARIIMGYR